MEVDCDALDVGIGFNEFEAEDKIPEDARKGNEQEDILEMDVDECNDKLTKSCKVETSQGKELGPNNSGLLENEDSCLGLCTENEKKNNSRKHRDGTIKKDSNGDRRRGRSSNKYSKSKLFKILHASPDLDPKILGREIAYRLGEAKVGLIINVVKVLGFGTAMEILEETKKIEKRGGMPTADRKRRRAPGGVYIFCLKEMGFASKDQVTEIFKEEKIKLREIIKRKRKEKNAKQRQEVSKLKELKQRVMQHISQLADEKNDASQIDNVKKTEDISETTEVEKNGLIDDII